ncbi:MAG: hypothetical protein N2512_08725 [Armatimonadetes bacterium]|nr:hypothetical protein [Armatimonadota bacterium]
MRTALRIFLAASCVTVCLGALAQGVGTSIWEKPGGETMPAASWLGSTGLVFVPSALVGPPMSAQGYFHWIKDLEGNDSNDEDTDVYLWGADVAVTSNLEVGAVRVDPRDNGSGETILNAKYNLDLGRWTNNPAAPEVAVGVRDLTDELSRTLYVVLTKNLELRETEGISRFSLSAGFGSSEEDDSPLDGFFVGLELVPASGFRLQGEYDGDAFNACLRFYPVRNLSLDIATIDGSLGVGATYRSGF